VKAFFTPLMFGMLLRTVASLRGYDLRVVVSSATVLFDFATDALFAVDLSFAFVGYVLALKLLDTHILSTERTALGWAVTLACYPPFWPLVYGAFLDYGRGGADWRHWWSGSPQARMAWGAVILVLTAIHVFSTVPFGIRFSNLTNRGVLTNGFFRYTKHPAYLSKNVFWWLMAMPFLTRGAPGDAVRACLLLAGVNLVYLLRARTEERHLSRDPAYVSYATTMERVGIFRWVGRLIPALRYEPHRLFAAGRGPGAPAGDPPPPPAAP
jgi:protein-S-isoprenylcysteine O-methyltransferase Ste14